MDSKPQTPKKPVHFTFTPAPLVIPKLTCPEPTSTPTSTPRYKHVYFYTICSGIIGFVSGYGVAKLNTDPKKR